MLWANLLLWCAGPAFCRTFARPSSECLKGRTDVVGKLATVVRGSGVLQNLRTTKQRMPENLKIVQKNTSQRKCG